MPIRPNHSADRSAALARPGQRDDWATIAALGVLAYMADNVLHEGFGHGLVALLSGAPHIVVTTVSMNAAITTRWIAAAGTLMNLFAAAVLWLLLRRVKFRSPHVRFLLLLTFAFNAFTGTGYFLFSGVIGIGDWADVIHGLHPHALWRAVLVAAGVFAYYMAMRLVASLLRPFFGELAGRSPRCLLLTVTPYIAAAVIATLAGLLNPLGTTLLWVSALPSTLGANIGLVYMKLIVRRPSPPQDNPGPISRSFTWLGIAAILSLAYIFVLGRGVSIGR